MPVTEESSLCLGTKSTEGERAQGAFLPSYPPLTHRALSEAPGFSVCIDRNPRSREQARRQANRKTPAKVRKKYAPGATCGHTPSKTSPRKREALLRKRSGFFSLPHNWLGTMAPPRAPAKRHTVVVCKFALGITAMPETKISILYSSVWVPGSSTSNQINDLQGLFQLHNSL
jgi:hypothetical protein